MNNTLALNTFIRWSGEVVNKAVWFVFMILLARSLGPDEFGYFNYAIAFGSLFVSFTDLGTNVYLVKEVSKDNSLTGKYLTNVIYIKTALSGLIFAAVVVAAYLSSKMPSVAVLFSLFLLISAFYDPLNSVFRAHKQMSYETLSMVAWRLAIVGVALIGIYLFKFRLLQISGSFIAASTVALLVPLYIMKKNYGAELAGSVWPDISLSRKILTGSIPLGMIIILSGLFFKLNIVILQHFRPGEELGWYSAAYKLIEGTFFIPSIFIGTLFPYLCENNSLNRLSDTGRSFFKKAFFFLALLAAGIAAAAALLAPAIINALYGAGFEQASGLLRVLLAGLVFIFLNELFYYMYMSVERQKDMIKSLAAAAVIYTVLCFLMIPATGAAGAAWALVIVQITLFMMNLAMYRGIK